MLVLTRRVGESIVMSGNVSITVLGSKGNQIRIGIDAPTSVNIAREELLTRPEGSRGFNKLSLKRA